MKIMMNQEAHHEDRDPRRRGAWGSRGQAPTVVMMVIMMIIMRRRRRRRTLAMTKLTMTTRHRRP
jgi:hypothetical protein